MILFVFLGLLLVLILLFFIYLLFVFLFSYYIPNFSGFFILLNFSLIIIFSI
jgi:hypothetical protein